MGVNRGMEVKATKESNSNRNLCTKLYKTINKLLSNISIICSHIAASIYF